MKRTTQLALTMSILSVITFGVIMVSAYFWEEPTQTTETLVLEIACPDPDVIFEVNSDGEMMFYKGSDVIGRLWYDDYNVFHFEGDAEESALRFFDAWAGSFEKELPFICEDLEGGQKR
jgi:hypothetical protein